MSHPEYTEREAKQYGSDIYQQKIEPHFMPGKRGKLAIIDPETGEYVVDGDFQDVINSLQAKNRGVHLYAVHIGFAETGRILRRLYSWKSLSYRTIDSVKPTQEMIDNARQRGVERYEQIRRQVEYGNERKTVVIDTQTGEYIMGEDLTTLLKCADKPDGIYYTHTIGFLGYMKLSFRQTYGRLSRYSDVTP